VYVTTNAALLCNLSFQTSLVCLTMLFSLLFLHNNFIIISVFCTHLIYLNDSLDSRLSITNLEKILYNSDFQLWTSTFLIRINIWGNKV